MEPIRVKLRQELLDQVKSFLIAQKFLLYYPFIKFSPSMSLFLALVFALTTNGVST